MGLERSRPAQAPDPRGERPAYFSQGADPGPPFQRAATFGLRCIKYPTANSRSATLTDPVTSSARNYATEQPVSERVFAVFRDLYAYDKTALNPVIESNDTSEPDWIRQRITF